ncbi:uncharacterized protein [Dendropsophus ebraccatus]|uniref:uncharacterized protein n=1 Tax=Dendropsophus ebraccatus TaxID=150705 RepID=UPI0038317298
MNLRMQLYYDYNCYEGHDKDEELLRPHDQEEPLDVKSLCERFQRSSHSNTLPAYTQRREEIISNIDSNPKLQAVKRRLEHQVRPVAPPTAQKPIATKPELLPKPNGLSNTNDMRLSKVFSQKLHITDPPKTKSDGVCAISPQTYRHSLPVFQDPPPKIDQPQSQVYEDVDTTWQKTPTTINIVDRKPSPPPIGPKLVQTSSSPILDVMIAKEKKKETVNESPSLKTLPSMSSLGLPPPKPDRPPNVDLSAFFPSQPKAMVSNELEESADVEYEQPCLSPNPSEGNVYDEAFSQKDPAESDPNVYEVEDTEYDLPDAMTAPIDAARYRKGKPTGFERVEPGNAVLTLRGVARIHGAPWQKF